MSTGRADERAVALERAHGALARLWRGEAPFLSAALLPAEWLFRLAQGTYHRAYDLGILPAASAPLPTIGVGNLAVGGSGKTPVSGWLVDELLRRGERPAVLHGGYAADEPALHARWHPDVPVLAGRDRARSASLAAGQGATVLVLDDAFQHRRLRRDLDIVLVAAERWTDRPKLLPRGPWREPMQALRRAGLVGVTRKTASAEQAAAVAARLAEVAPGAAQLLFAIVPAGWRRWLEPRVPASARAAPPGPGVAQPPAQAREVPLPGGVLVCGVADPELFLVSAEQSGARPSGVLVFPDHHAFAGADLARIRAAAAGGCVLTTEKDAVKLSALAPDLDLRVLQQVVRLEAGGADLDRALDRVLQPRSRPDDGAR